MVGIWHGVDALADEPEQVNESPFSYAWNNPVKLTDPDSNCPRCIKALLKTAVKSIAKGKVDLGGIYDAVDAGKTLISRSSTMLERGEALFNLLSPVSTKDVKSLKKLGNSVDIKPNIGTTIADPKMGISDKAVSNPYGSKGKPDHQAKVDELANRAKDENPGMDVITERKIQGHDSNRKPDVQVVDPETGKATKIYEAERKPESTRNKKREAEYEKLDIPYETHKVGGT